MNFGPRGLIRRMGSRFFRTTASHIATYCVEILRASPPTSVLDLGCGTGALLADVSEAYSLERVVGVDFSASSIALAEARWPDRKTYTFECGAVEHSRALAERYDAVLAIGLFDYLQFDETLLGRMLRAASQTLIVTLPRRRLGLQRLARRCWLGMHGVTLWAYDQEEMDRIFRSTPEASHFRVDHPIAPHIPDNLWLIARRCRAS